MPLLRIFSCGDSRNPFSHQHRCIGHHPYHRVFREESLEKVQRHAAHDRQDQLVRTKLIPQRLKHCACKLRLDREYQNISLPCRLLCPLILRVVGECCEAIPGRKVHQPLLIQIGNRHHLRAYDAACDRTAEDRFTHLPTADDTNPFLF